MRKMIIFTYFYMLITCIWLQVTNKAKVTHQGEGQIKVKEKYLHPFQLYVAHTVSKRVVCIRLKCILTHYQIAENCVLYGSTDGMYIYFDSSTNCECVMTVSIIFCIVYSAGTSNVLLQICLDLLEPMPNVSAAVNLNLFVH